VISRVVNSIRERLEDKGYTTTNADIQAILWYPEKDLWAKLRGEKESNLKNSYDQEFLKLADKLGLGKEARAAIERSRADRATRAGGENDASAAGEVRRTVDELPLKKATVGQVKKPLADLSVRDSSKPLQAVSF
jgi:hypothetical protein